MLTCLRFAVQRSVLIPEAYSESCQTSKMELLCENSKLQHKRKFTKTLPEKIDMVPRDTRDSFNRYFI